VQHLTTKYVIREADGEEHAYYADPSQGHIDGMPALFVEMSPNW